MIVLISIYGLLLFLVIMFIAGGTVKPTPKQEDEQGKDE